MIHLIKLIYNPGGENEIGNMAPRNEEDPKENSEENVENSEENVEKNEDDKDPKTFMEKVKEALHDWSNKDDQDQRFDDTRV